MKASSSHEQAIESFHLLIVEDEDNLKLSLSLIARKAGYRVSVAADARDALRILKESADGPDRIDVLVMDIQMPGMNGIELYAELERRDALLPVVIMSGYQYREIITGLHADGRFSYLEKPFEPEDFIAHIENAIQPLTHASAVGDGSQGKPR